MNENSDEENTIAVISILGPIVDGDQVPGVASGDNVSSLFDKIIEKYFSEEINKRKKIIKENKI